MKVTFRSCATMAAFMIAGALFLSSCGSTGEKQPANETEKPDQSSAPVQDISFTDANGKAVSLSSLKGKVVFINFWATWCPPCKAELPSINKLKQHYSKDDAIAFLFVDINEPVEKAKAFMDEHQYDLPVYVPNGPIPSEFLGQAIPTTVILDKSGKMVVHAEGSRDYGNPEIKRVLDSLVASEG